MMEKTGSTVVYLTLDDALGLHAESIRRFGGSDGIRDLGLLESALAMPSMSFGGEDLHEMLHEKAAAYLFHVAKNHPFVDGNKRAALEIALVFLDLNGLSVEVEDAVLIELVLSVAEGQQSKSEVAQFFASRLRTRHG